MSQPPATVWADLSWQRPLAPEAALGVIRHWAADGRSPHLLLEAHAADGQVRYQLGGPAGAVSAAATFLASVQPGTTLLPETFKRPDLDVAGRLHASTRHRAIGQTGSPESLVKPLLAALASVARDEYALLQVVLGPRRIPLSVPTRSPSSIVRPWYEVAWYGNGGQVDSEKRTALRTKVSDHGFACTVRLGVRAGSPNARRRILHGLLAALRSLEAPGVQLRLKPEAPARLVRGLAPRFGWPLRLNVAEVLTLSAWPLGAGELPGQAPEHPRQLPPASSHKAGNGARLVAHASAPGATGDLTLSAKGALHHLHVVGPTGVGKSALLTHLITADMAAGRAVVVIEPKDLVDDVLARVPAHRRDDIVVLDPTDSRPVGFNPLTRTTGTSSELLADNLLHVFKALYREAWGPRLQDILHASLLTLARRDDASLVMLPLLLTNAGFRRSLTSGINDPIGLGPFWTWYEALSDAERAAVIAPVMNKLRQWLVRPSLRAVLGQREPRFDLEQVFTDRKIFLVPLRAGVMGPESAELLGSLVVSRLWQTTLGRTRVPAERRHPVMVYVDEVQDFLHLPTDLGDALAQARGLGVSFTLAHQYLGQLPPAMRAAVLTNARSRVAFQLTNEDAVALAKGHPELAPDDFTALGQYEVYASLFAGGRATPYASGRTLPPSPRTSDPRGLRRASARRWGQDADEVEAGFATMLDPLVSTNQAGPTGRRPRRPRS